MTWRCRWASAWPTRWMSGWGLKFFDYDNDGNLDLILSLMDSPMTSSISFPTR